MTTIGERLKINTAEHGNRNEGDMKDLTEQLVKIIVRAEARGVTRYRLAKDAGISPAQLTHLLRGTRKVSVNTLARLADALGYDVRFVRRKSR